MHSRRKTYACLTFGALAALATPAAAATGGMPVAEQNALVGKYCAGCHSDATMTGGLSLQRFDAAHADPGVAAMLVSKLKGRAMSASGIPMPDHATQDALLIALSAKAVGAGAWTVSQSPILTAGIVQEVPSSIKGEEPDLYRLTITCRVDTHEAGMQLAWAPGDVPMPGGTISAAVDGKAPFIYSVDHGAGAANLYATKQESGTPKYDMPLPTRTLTISSLFPRETVVFPFDSLSPAVRQTLSTCFTGIGTAR